MCHETYLHYVCVMWVNLTWEGCHGNGIIYVIGCSFNVGYPAPKGCHGEIEFDMGDGFNARILFIRGCFE